MKIRTPIIAAGAAVLLGTTGALVLPAVTSAHSATHTLKFISVTNKVVFFTKARMQIGVQDTGTNTAGKIIGFDEIYGKAISATSAPRTPRSIPVATC